MAKSKSSNKTMSDRNKSILIIILLVVGLLPLPIIGILGLILMWYWKKWSKMIRIVITVIFVVIAIILIGIYYYFHQLGYPPRKITQVEANALSQETFNKINEYRQTKGLQQLKIDENLCKYAERRLDQIAKDNGYNKYEEFKADINNEQIAKKYFSDYVSVNYDGDGPLDSTKKADWLIKFWSAHPRVINNLIYTNACVKADSDTIVIVAGQHK